MRTFVPDRTCWSLLLTALAIRLRYKPMYDKLRFLIINKDLRKSLARKNGNESPIWSWNDSVPVATNLFIFRFLTSNMVVSKKILPVFIKSIVFHHVGLSLMIEMEEQYDSSVDEHNEEWCTGGPWFNEIFFQRLHGPLFEELFNTAHKYTYDLMRGFMPTTNVNKSPLV